MKHKDQIENLAEWKTKPDHFFYNKFFDPYIKRELEVMPVSLINNRPSLVLSFAASLRTIRARHRLLTWTLFLIWSRRQCRVRSWMCSRRGTSS